MGILLLIAGLALLALGAGWLTETITYSIAGVALALVGFGAIIHAANACQVCTRSPSSEPRVPPRAKTVLEERLLEAKKTGKLGKWPPGWYS